MRIVLIALIAAAAVCGCRHTGVRVVASSRSTANLGDVNWDEYKIPVFSLYSGPSMTVWINRDYLAVKKISGRGSVTNAVSALGIYVAAEDKTASVEMEFDTQSQFAADKVAEDK
ncbi:MAG: hypothetical protein MJ138_07430 [Kiritimatiellae bacterium]|nr:hypothetical protein [Kiritimatiellia bacterium]